MLIKSFIRFLFVCLFLSHTTAFAKNVQIELLKEQKQIELGYFVSYQLTDKDMNVSNITENFHIMNWQATDSQVPVLPRTEQAYWLYFDVKNTGLELAQSYLFIDSPLLDSIEVYLQDLTTGSTDKIGQSGLYQSVSSRAVPHRSFIFPVNIDAQSEYRVLFKIENDSFFQLPISLWSPSDLIAEDGAHSLLLGVCLGILLIASLFGIVIYFTASDKSFLYYSLFSISFLLFFSSLKGFTLQLIWPGMPYISQAVTMIALGFTLGFINLFINEFLSFQKYHDRLFWAAKGLAYASFIFAFISIPLPHMWRVYLLIFVLLLTICLFISASIIYLKKSRKSANRFLWCFGVISLSVLLFVANRFGWVPRNLVTEYSVVISQFFAYIVLFGSLADKIKIERRKRLKAQLEAMHHFQQFYDIYEHAVEGHFTTTENGKIIRANKAFYELLGYIDLEELLGHKSNTREFYVVPREREKLVAKAREFGRIIGFEAQWRRSNGKKIWVSINLRYEPESTDGSVLIGSLIDISEKKKSASQLEFLASHDSLTGLLNRREFERMLNEALFECSDTNSKHTLLYMDLDQFKLVNDTCGHKAGDILLRQLTEELRDALNQQGSIARLGGDEFGVLLKDCIGDAAFVIAFRLKQAVQDFRFVWENRVFTLGISIGMVEVSSENHSIDQVLSIADTACYTAKDKGRNRIHAYTESDADVKNRHDEMRQVSKINDALAHDRFRLEFQTLYPINRHTPMQHYEILIRMLDENDKLVPPGAFLPAAERYGIMPSIDKWVINHYFAWLQTYPQHMDRLAKCAINLSGPSLADEDMQIYILNCFEKYRIPYEKICFEITESLAIQQLDETLSFIKCFHKLGCTFALDDFGSGFSSYGYLKNLPVDYVKIDGSFVKDMLIDPIDRAMVKSINEVAKAIGMETVAEFVESEEILADLKQIGIDYAQGYGIAKPKPLSELLKSKK